MALPKLYYFCSLINIDHDEYMTIQCIENELKKPLPGIQSQKIMAPESRLRTLVAESGESKKSGVLLLLYFKNDILNLVFIIRAIDESVHSGQISFPGGKYDEVDKDLIDTSLRETFEEIGVNPSDIQILGNLTNLFIPVSNYIVSPYIGFSTIKPSFKLNDAEVAGIIEIPLAHFLNEQNRITGTVEVRGTVYEVPVFKVGEHQIWGATAMILSEFVALLKNSNIQF